MPALKLPYDRVSSAQLGLSMAAALFCVTVVTGIIQPGSVSDGLQLWSAMAIGLPAILALRFGPRLPLAPFLCGLMLIIQAIIGLGLSGKLRGGLTAEAMPTVLICLAAVCIGVFLVRTVATADFGHDRA